MERLKLESYVLVTIQFVSAAALIYLTMTVPLGILAVGMITAASGLGLWAIFSMRFGNLRINPIPKSDAKLVTRGPYLLIRHPMYTAVLLAMLGVTININSALAYLIWIILLVDLLVKMKFEEKLLLGKFSEYEAYMKRSKRLLPFLW